MPASAESRPPSFFGNKPAPIIELQNNSQHPLLKEPAETLREKFGLDPDELPLLRIYEDEATVLKPSRLPKPVCRDADDDEVLATALAAQA